MPSTTSTACGRAGADAADGVIHTAFQHGSADIADAVGRCLKLPVAAVPREETADHFGWFGPFFARDVPASSALAQKRLGWHPERPGLVEDLESGHCLTNA